MTAVEWIISQYIKDGLFKKGVYEQAKEMEKQQIIDAYQSGDGDAYNLDATKQWGEEYYTSNYVHPLEDDVPPTSQYFPTSSQTEISDIVDLKTQNNTLFDNAEISDEEIEDRAAEWMEEDWDVKTYYEAFIDGASWYREQLKFK